MELYDVKPVLPQRMVMKMIEAACQKAEELNIQVNIAVCDDGGNLKAFVRMDGAMLMSAEIAQNKAYSAVASKRATADWYPLMEKNPTLLHGIVHTNRLCILAGGIPVYINNQLVGGIGVSGGTGQEDVLCAEAGLAVLETWLSM